MLNEQSDYGKQPFIDIPASAFEVKAIYWTEPDRSVIKEIKAFVAKTGRPYLWPRHTHTKPPKGARPVYLGEFDLPEAYLRNSTLHSPCPCCCPKKPKFALHGKIAWFPDEGVIRLIGPDCFKTLNPSGHEEAVAELRRREARESDIAYLLRLAQNVRFIRDAIDENLEIATAVEKMRNGVLAALDEHNIPLWNHVRNGELKITKEKIRVSQSASGATSRTSKIIQKTYAHIKGYELVSPFYSSIVLSLTNARKMLDAIDLSAKSVAEIEGMDDATRTTTARGLKQTLAELREKLQKLDELRRFASFETIKTLKTWATREDAALNFHVDRKDDKLVIGASPIKCTRLLIDLAVDRNVTWIEEMKATDFN
ncbi:hypothetical protein [Hyphomicrobium sp. 2TAF46]|uniref:hypothetical protein n=1 Tax=Hyphomicrobium sp. 2TAF46 TaxID=3233019 RepID=UPI003F8EC049